jgi:hypothetical protein
VAGEAGDGAEVLPPVRTLRPDVVLMDVRMPAVDGIQATNDDYVYDALRAGPTGSCSSAPGPRTSCGRSAWS